MAAQQTLASDCSEANRLPHPIGWPTLCVHAMLNSPPFALCWQGLAIRQARETSARDGGRLRVCLNRRDSHGVGEDKATTLAQRTTRRWRRLGTMDSSARRGPVASWHCWHLATGSACWRLWERKAWPSRCPTASMEQRENPPRRAGFLVGIRLGTGWLAGAVNT